jgi:hypothetical protein
MRRLTVINLTKMSEQSRLYYLQDLLQDATECIQDLTDNKVQYGYVQAILNHATQAVLDLEKLTKAVK